MTKTDTQTHTLKMEFEKRKEVVDVPGLKLESV